MLFSIRNACLLLVITVSFAMEEADRPSVKKWIIARSFTGLEGDIRVALFDRTGEVIFLGGNSNLALLHTLSSGELIELDVGPKEVIDRSCTDAPELEEDSESAHNDITKAAFNPAADELAVLCGNQLQIFDFEGNLTRLLEYDQYIMDVAYNDAGTRFLTAMMDGRIFILDVDRSELKMVRTISPLFFAEFLPPSITHTKKESILSLGPDCLMVGVGEDAHAISAVIDDKRFPRRVKWAFYDRAKDKIVTLAHGAHAFYPRPSRLTWYDEELCQIGECSVGTKVVTINRLKHELLVVSERNLTGRPFMMIGRVDETLLSYRCEGEQTRAEWQICAAIANAADDRILLTHADGTVKLWKLTEELPGQ